MIIPLQLLINRKIDINLGDYCINRSLIDNESLSVILLCVLYHNDKISRKSFTSRMNRYKGHNGDRYLSRKIGLHKSKILDKFFDDVCYTDVLLNEVVETCLVKDISIEDYLKYLNIGFSKNRNYCVNFIYFNIFKPVLYSGDGSFIRDFLKSINIEIEYYSYDECKDRDYLTNGYCCDDCDGPLEDYKKIQYQFYYNKLNIKDVDKRVIEIFSNMKKHLKNPNEKLVIGY